MATKEQLRTAIDAERQQAAARRQADQEKIAALTAEVTALKAQLAGSLSAADSDEILTAIPTIVE